jgi:antitoxin HicB
VNLESTIDEYPFTVRPLAAEDGGGFLIEYPDLPGCISDGDTAEEAIRNGRDAVLSYLRSCVQHTDPIPRPGSTERAARVPLTISVKRIRTRAKLSQAEFAKRYGFKVRTLQDWELGRAKPDAAVRAYLTVIAKNPDAVEDALVR